MDGAIFLLLQLFVSKTFHVCDGHERYHVLVTKKSSYTTCHTLKLAKQNAADNLTPFCSSASKVLLNCILHFAHFVALVVPAAEWMDITTANYKPSNNQF